MDDNSLQAASPLRPAMPMPQGAPQPGMMQQGVPMGGQTAMGEEALGQASSNVLTPQYVHQAYNLSPAMQMDLASQVAMGKHRLADLDAQAAKDDANPVEWPHMSGLFGVSRAGLYNAQNQQQERDRRKQERTDLLTNLIKFDKLSQGGSPEEVEAMQKVMKGHYDAYKDLNQSAREGVKAQSEIDLQGAQAKQAMGNYSEAMARRELLMQQANDVVPGRATENNKLIADQEKIANDAAKAFVEATLKQQELNAGIADKINGHRVTLRGQDVDLAKARAQMAANQTEMVYPAGMNQGVPKHPGLGQPQGQPSGNMIRPPQRQVSMLQVPPPPELQGQMGQPQAVNPQFAAAMDQLSQGAQRQVPQGPQGQPGPQMVPPPPVMANNLGQQQQPQPGAPDAGVMQALNRPGPAMPMAGQQQPQQGQAPQQTAQKPQGQPNRAAIKKRAMEIGAGNHNISPGQAVQMAMQEAQGVAQGGP